MNNAYARTQTAQRKLDLAHAALVRSAAPLRTSLRRRPATWLIGGGFAAGLVAGFVPMHRWLQTGISLASTAMRLMTPFLAGIEAARNDVAVTAKEENA